MVLALIFILSTCKAVNVPKDVIDGWLALVTVAAEPETLPVTSPVISPLNAVDVILVAPVTTPASILMVPSRTIADPPKGVILIAPLVDLMVLALIFILSTCKAVNVPKDVIDGWLALVTVAAEPETLPVTSPVISPLNAVDVILVAPVTTPASILMVPSRTIADPPKGVILIAPLVELMVLALIFILSTVKLVKANLSVVIAPFAI